MKLRLVAFSAIVALSACKKTDPNASVKEGETNPDQPAAASGDAAAPGETEETTEAGTTPAAAGSALEQLNSMIIGVSSKKGMRDLIDGFDKATIDPATLTMTINGKAIKASNPNELATMKIYQQSIKPLKRFRAIAWRIEPLLKQCKNCRAVIQNAIKGAFLKDFMVGPHIRAFMQYVTEADSIPQFKDVADMQDNFMIPLSDELWDTSQQLKGIVARTGDEGAPAALLPDNFTFQFDNYLLTGFDPASKDQFMSAKHRFKLITKGNVELLVAQKYRLIGLLRWASQYNFEDSSLLAELLMKSAGLFNDDGGAVDQQTPKDFMDKLAGHPQLLTLRNPGAATPILQRALQSFALSYKFRLSGMIRTRADAIALRKVKAISDRNFFIRPDALETFEKDTIEVLTKKNAIWQNATKNQPTLVISDVTGMKIKVNPAAFFNNVQDLRKFLPAPTGFVAGERQKCIPSTDANAPCVQGSNYYYGRPNAWTDPTMAGVFPEATQQTLQSVIRTAKRTPETRRIALVIPML